MLATIPAATLLGVEGRSVTVEVHVSNGLPGFTIVGLPDTSCREARDRVRAALLSMDLPWPLRRVTVNLAPSGLRKAGTGLDLPIAVALLVATEVVKPAAVEGIAFLGELGLDGSVRRVPGILSMVDALDAATVVVPAAAAEEAGLVGRHRVLAVRSLREVVEALTGEAPWPDPPPPADPPPEPPPPDLAEVRGQLVGRWALEIAAAGGHHLLLVGPPGSGKTMLARRLTGLLPALPDDLALEVTKVHSAAGLDLPVGGLIRRPPFRAPHHGASPVSLVGGGTGHLRPGEISLASNGCLFLDELGEFAPSVLDQLRQPLEDGTVRIARARATATFPARFLLVAAMNPCPCGEGVTPGRCRCSDVARGRYLRRVSGPLLDRFDLRLTVLRPSVDELLGAGRTEPTAVVAERVRAARERAAARGVRVNADLTGAQVERAARLTPGAAKLLEGALRSGGLTARGLHRVQRVALTVADLGGDDQVGEEHLCSALELRADVLRQEALAG